eukprot:364212-Chlamydomonas_euryale.AAC.4
MGVDPRWSTPMCPHTCGGAYVIPSVGRIVRPNSMICSIKPCTVSIGTAKPSGHPRASGDAAIMPTTWACRQGGKR